MIIILRRTLLDWEDLMVQTEEAIIRKTLLQEKASILQLGLLKKKPGHSTLGEEAEELLPAVATMQNPPQKVAEVPEETVVLPIETEETPLRILEVAEEAQQVEDLQVHLEVLVLPES